MEQSSQTNIWDNQVKELEQQVRRLRLEASERSITEIPVIATQSPIAFFDVSAIYKDSIEYSELQLTERKREKRYLDRQMALHNERVKEQNEFNRSGNHTSEGIKAYHAQIEPLYSEHNALEAERNNPEIRKIFEENLERVRVRVSEIQKEIADKMGVTSILSKHNAVSIDPKLDITKLVFTQLNREYIARTQNCELSATPNQESISSEQDLSDNLIVQNNNNEMMQGNLICVTCERKTTGELKTFNDTICCGNLICEDCLCELQSYGISKCPYCMKLSPQEEVSINARALRELLKSSQVAPCHTELEIKDAIKISAECLEQERIQPTSHVCRYWHQNYFASAEVKITDMPSEAFLDAYKSRLESALKSFGYEARIEKQGPTGFRLMKIMCLQGRELLAFSREKKCDCKNNYQLGGNAVVHSPISLLTLVGIVKQIDEQLALQKINQ